MCSWLLHETKRRILFSGPVCFVSVWTPGGLARDDFGADVEELGGRARDDLAADVEELGGLARGDFAAGGLARDDFAADVDGRCRHTHAHIRKISRSMHKNPKHGSTHDNYRVWREKHAHRIKTEQSAPKRKPYCVRMHQKKANIHVLCATHLAAIPPGVFFILLLLLLQA